MKYGRSPTLATAEFTAAYYVTPDRWIHAEVIGSNGVLTQGRTLAQAKKNLRAAIQNMINTCPYQLPGGPRQPWGRPIHVENIVWVIQ